MTVMRQFTAIATLLLWISCYLNCSTGLYAQVSDLLGDGTIQHECSSCPDNRPNPSDVPMPCVDCGLIALEIESRPLFFQDEDGTGATLDHFALFSATEGNLFLLDSHPIPAAAHSLRSEQIYAHISRPIRGPAA